MPRTPMDRLPKLARTISCVIVTDSEAADAYEIALGAFTSQEQELAGSFPRRAAAVRASLPVTLTAEEASEALERLREADAAVMAPFQAALAEAEEALDAVREQWTFRSLGRSAWRDLVKANPPTDEDNAFWEAEGGTGQAPYSFENLPRPLLAAATVSPRVTRADIDDMFDGEDWSDAELTTLFQHALVAQQQARPDPKARR